MTATKPLSLPVTAVLIPVVVLAVGVGALAASSGAKGSIIAIGMVLMIVGCYVALVHPRVIYVVLAFALGVAPVMVVPGVPVPFALAMVFAAWFALLTHPIVPLRITSVHIAVLGLVVASTIGMIMMNDGGKAHTFEYVKWTLATSLVFLLTMLSRSDLRAFGRAFVYGTTLGTALALALWRFDSAGTFMGHLAPLGYGQKGAIGTYQRYYESSAGKVVRLTGTYVDPNLAGIFIFIALLLAITLFRGKRRLFLCAVLATGLIITLSRASIFSFVVGVVILLLFGSMQARMRRGIIGAVAVAAVAALAIPAVNDRILSSFGSDDKGTKERAEALDNFTNSMRGHWWFGHGFGARELVNEVAGWKVNYVANSPLLTVYRAGILAGIAFVVLLVVGAVWAYRNMRKTPWESGVIGAGFIGFSLVALQLDFPVVTQPPVTMAFSVFVAFLSANPIEPEDGTDGHTAELYSPDRPEAEIRDIAYAAAR